MKHTAIVPLILSGVVGCASTSTSSQLADARVAYVRLEESSAARVVPADVLTAKQALERAEAKHQEDPGSAEEQHLAYLAKRQSDIARARAEYVFAKRDQEHAKSEYDRLQATLRQRAERSLKNSQEELKKTQAALSDVQKALEREGSENAELVRKEAELQERKAALEASLAAEAKAREEAEKRASLALASLEELARVKEEARETIITLSGEVLFATGKSELLPLARERLRKVAAALKEQDTEAKFVVLGHTDSRGSDASNDELSRARAESVRQMLIASGVPADRIEAVGRGEREPVASNNTPEGRANNRRVEIRVLRK